MVCIQAWFALKPNAESGLCAYKPGFYPRLYGMYLILTEYEVNIGNKSRVKDRGEAEVFYEVFISYTDQVRSQY